MKKTLAPLLMLIATPAAAWTVSQQKDPMTDKALTWASATSGTATLLVGCLNGSVQPRVTWPNRIGLGTIGASYRIDDGPVVPRMAMLSQTGDALYLWPMDGGWVRTARRVRVNVGQAFYDFDLAKGQALPAIRC